MIIGIPCSSVLLTTGALYPTLQRRFRSNPAVLVETVRRWRGDHLQSEWSAEECFRFAQSVNASFITFLEDGVYPLGSRHSVQQYSACDAQNPPLPLIIPLSQLQPSVLPTILTNSVESERTINIQDASINCLLQAGIHARTHSHASLSPAFHFHISARFGQTALHAVHESQRIALIQVLFQLHSFRRATCDHALPSNHLFFRMSPECRNKTEITRALTEYRAVA